MKKSLIFLTVLVCIVALAFVGCKKEAAGGADGPVEFTMYYTDNPTLPFRADWLAVRTAEQMYNAKINWEVIPSTDYGTKVQLALSTGQNAPDVILYQSISGTNIQFADNGAIYPISDKAEWTPEWTARVREYGLQADVDLTRRLDGKLYNLPALYDKPFYDGGLLIREDLINQFGLPTPKTFDDLYNLSKAYKQLNPSSFPITVLVNKYVHYRMSQPSWGISVHTSGAGGSRVLSWDYNRNEFFAGAISDQYRDYMRFWNKMYAEGLLDHEIAPPIDNDVWNRKLATGYSIASYAYYDQIGGIEAASNIPGIKFNMIPPLQGPAGAYHQQKSKTSAGILFPMGTSKRSDFERVVRTIDSMFFSKEAELLWCIGVEGQSYTKEGVDPNNVTNIRFVPSLVNSPDGIYKAGQLQFGLGTATLQYVWINAREMIKYDENYARINAEVAAMNGIQAVPPTPKFRNTTDTERAGELMSMLMDAFEVWDDDFLTGRKSLDSDWAAYVADMNRLGIQEYLTLYNNNK